MRGVHDRGEGNDWQKMHDYLTTREVAELLRIGERKVYDLATSGRIPCTKATGKLLFSRVAIQGWLDGHSVTPEGAARTVRPNVFLGSHDPLLDWAIRESECGIATYFDGSSDGLDRFAQDEGIAAGIHLFDTASGTWNARQVEARFSGRPVVLAEWAKRERGLVLPARERTDRAVADLKGLRFTPRQSQSGSQPLFLHLLAQSGMTERDLEMMPAVRTETDAALSVLEGKADACFGLQSVAAQYGLAFSPLVEERFDLLVDRRDWFQPPFQAFLAFCRSDAFARRVAETKGYDFSGFATVHFNG